MAGASLELEPHREPHSSVEPAPYLVCAGCALVYPTLQSWETATRPVHVIGEDGRRERCDEMRLCPCGAPMVRR